MRHVWSFEFCHPLHFCNYWYMASIFYNIVLVACKLDHFITQRWYIVLSPLWISSLLLLMCFSCLTIISSEGMLKEEEEQRHYRRLRTGYAITSLVVAILVELLGLLWLEGVMNTYVIIVLIPYYMWTLFYITKLILL